MHSKQELRETGTTTIGLVCKDCVILASDTKSTLGYMVSSKEIEKIVKIDDKLALTTAGGVGDTQALIRTITAEINLYKSMRNAEFTVRAAVTLLSNVLQGTRYYPYMAMLIVGGHDRDGCHIYSIDPMGGSEETSKFTATGSGSPFAYGVLESDYKENMSKDEAMRVAAKAIKSSRERDIFSGGKTMMVAIDKNGLEFISDEKLKEIENQAMALAKNVGHR
ncbi:MAG: archaeal proteasome endopeptidase complex subunit beta [Candidatus Aenigmatarchaeota archaeon]